MDNRVRHRANQCEPFAAHQFGYEMPIDPAEPLDHGTEEIEMQIAGRQRENALECRPVNASQKCRLYRSRLRGAGFAIDQGHFPKKIVRLDKSERLLLSAPTRFGDANATVAYQVKALAPLSFVKNYRIFVVAPERDTSDDFTQQFLRDAGKQPIIPDCDRGVGCVSVAHHKVSWGVGVEALPEKLPGVMRRSSMILA